MATASPYPGPDSMEAERAESCEVDKNREPLSKDLYVFEMRHSRLILLRKTSFLVKIQIT